MLKNRRQFPLLHILLLILVLAVAQRGMSGPVFQVDEGSVATPPAEEKSAAESPAANEEPDTLFKMITASGASGIGFMLALGLFSVFGAAIAIERLINLTRTKVMPPGFIQDLQELNRKKENRTERFQELALRSQSPISNVLKAGLLRVGRPLPEVEKSMEDAVAKEIAGLRGSVRPLSVVGNVAPLLGLLGTVVGMIDAFRVASQAGLGKAELLAQGIYLALLTTAAGLMIAIPAVLLAAFFNNRIDKFMWEADTYLMETMPSFAAMRPVSAD